MEETEIIPITQVNPRITQCPKCQKRYPNVKIICENCGEKMSFSRDINRQFITGNVNTRIIEGIRKVAEGKKKIILIRAEENLDEYLKKARDDWSVIQELNMGRTSKKRMLIPKTECQDCGTCNDCKKCLKCGLVFKSKSDNCPECSSGQTKPAYINFEIKKKKRVCPYCNKDNISPSKINLNLEEEYEKIELIKSSIEDLELIPKEKKEKAMQIAKLLTMEIKCPLCSSENIKTMKSRMFDYFTMERRRVW